MSELAYNRYSGEQMPAMLEEITDLYVEIRSEYTDGQGIFSRQSFIDRTNSQARKAGFKLVTVTSRGILVGFSFGLPIPPGSWWAECTSPPQEVLDASKFAVIELDVRKEYRVQGIGKKLLGELLADRGENFATLASIPESSAHAMYIRWGWRKVGVFEDSMDALLIPLKD
jgi:GNAT superfamily N-acetyltransferase